MLKTSGYYDLNIQESCFDPITLPRTLKILYEFGYRTIAINQTIHDCALEPNKKKKKGEPRDSDCVPVPYDTSFIIGKTLEFGFKDFTVLNRLTVVFSSQESVHRIVKSPNYKKYDIIAVLPETQSAYMFVCSNLDADILTLDPQNKLSLRLNRRLYNQLVDKGMHFELLYSAAIEDSYKRKNLIHVSHIYHSIGKSRNILFSSGARNYMLLRSPYDVISLGFIFGLNLLQCKTAVTHCPRKAVINSVGRRHGKAVMFVKNEETDDEDESDISKIVIKSSSSGEEDMETDEPAQKKSKQ